MDTVQMVGGANGLKKIADALRKEGFAIDAIYLIKLVHEDDREDWVVRLVTRGSSHDVVYRFFKLRNDGKIPRFGDRIRIDAITPDHPEASQVIAYARRFDRLPVEIETVLLDGMLIDYALVAELPGANAAAA